MLRAAGLARRCQGALHLYCAVDAETGDEASDARTLPAGAALEALLAERRRNLDRIIAALPDLLGRVRSEIHCAEPHDRLIPEVASRIRARYVVKDVRGESVLRRALLSPLDWALIRTLPCDLLLVGAAVTTPASRRVLAAVNVLAESPELERGLNARILGAARALASHLDATVELASVVPWPPGRRSGAHGAHAAEAADTGEPPGDSVVSDHQRAFRRFAELQNVPSAHRHRLLGDPVQALATLADELEADVTVIGNIYRQGYERGLLGGTAEMLLQKLKTDLLITKQPQMAQHIDLRHDELPAGRVAQR